MRQIITLVVLLLLTQVSFAQSNRRSSKPFIYSATSEWQKVTLKPGQRQSPTPTVSSQPVTPTQPPATNPSPTPQPDLTKSDVPATSGNVVSTPATEPDPAPSSPVESPAGRLSASDASATTTSPDFRPAFTGDFVTNRNGWKAGNHGDFHYQIGMGRYSIRKRNPKTQQVAFAHVSLPTNINLNRSLQFTIKLDVLADSGKVPTGGILFGVKDSLNFSAFTINGKGEASIIRVADGEATSTYMPGEFFKPGVAVERNRNRLTIRRQGNSLHFYINEREIRSSPYPFRVFPGNDVGVITSAYWTTFQKLSVTLGASDLPSQAMASDYSTAATTVASDVPASSPAAISTSAVKENTASSTHSFSESFTTNQHRWLVGKKNGYELEVMQGSYYIRKIAATASHPARTYIPLPSSIDLNKAESFTITADMTVPPGVQPNGGLLIGVQDVNNYCQFQLIGTNLVSVKSLIDGGTFANYMPGKPVPPRVSVNKERNTLMIKKELNQLHFYINGEEVVDSPHVFRKFRGNKIGFITGSKTVKFQNLTVQTGK
ncbi:hypothetical protein WBJ53_20865 [Spirosoma sp. SC4-14]|uniref:hypothetical protein n=1 Tax=Spirosoma sp. SC4-14 TaxID=3128900 RepID=UPI0030CA9CA1